MDEDPNNMFGFMQDNYFMYPGGYPQMFPMVSVPMNMNGFQMMPYMPNMMMNMGMTDPSGSQLYGPKYNEFMALPTETVLNSFDDYVLDQQGCKFLQARLENERPESDFFLGVYKLLTEKLIEYSEDQFANYLCQKLIELCDVQQLSYITSILLPTLVEMSSSPHGTRVI